MYCPAPLEVIPSSGRADTFIYVFVNEYSSLVWQILRSSSKAELEELIIADTGRFMLLFCHCAYCAYSLTPFRQPVVYRLGDIDPSTSLMLLSIIHMAYIIQRGRVKMGRREEMYLLRMDSWLDVQGQRVGELPALNTICKLFTTSHSLKSLKN